MSQPPVKVTLLVDARDGYCCVRCGASLEVVPGSRHHRQRRRDGGHTPENLILLCGSGTTGCHGWVHANPRAAQVFGYIVPANGRATPDVIPVYAWAWPSRTRHGWFVLDSEGLRERIPEAEALEILATFGITWEGAPR